MALDSTVVIGLDTPPPGAGLAQAAGWIADLVRNRRRRVVVVAGASCRQRRAGIARANRMSPTTDAHDVALAMVQPDLDAAEAVGEALRAAGLRVEVSSGEGHAPLSRGGPLDAEPRLVDARAYADAFELGSEVLVVPASVGRDFDGRVTSLGDEGSTLTAAFVAQRLALPLTVLRDMDAEWRVPRRAALFARRHGLRFDVVSPGGAPIARFDPLAPDEPSGPRLRVALLGLGRVGMGVFQKLAGSPESYEIVGVALSSRDARFAGELPPRLVSFDAGEILSRRADVIIDLTEPDDPMSELGDEARRSGANVVRGSGSWSPAPRIPISTWRAGASAASA